MLPLLRGSLPAGMEEVELLHHSSRTLVVRGRHPVHGSVVLKTTASALPEPTEIARYRHEHRALRILGGAGVAGAVGAVALDERGGRPLLLLEDTGGGTIWQREQGTDMLCAWLVQLATALDQIHRAGIIHRDLSLANLICVPETGAVSIIDFGECAIFTGRHADVEPPMVPRGTLAYLSPEQTGRIGRRVDVRADLYSLGACLWHLIVGRPPFDMDDPLSVVHAHLTRSPPPPRALRADCPAPLSAIVMKLMEKDPADRYQSAAGLLADARRCAAAPGVVFALGSADQPARFVYPSELFGRDAERARLRATYVRVREGQPAAVLITGPAGVGKSVLAAELAPLAALDQGFFAIGGCEADRVTPYRSWIAVLRTLLRSLLSRGRAAVAARRAAILSVFSRGGGPWRDALPELAIILGEEDRADTGPALGPDATRARAQASVVALLRALCTPGSPVVLVFDGAQWIDPASADLLQTVRAEKIPGLLLLVTSRPGAALPSGLSTLSLGPLPADSVRAMVAACCRCRLEEATELAAVLMVKTGGNPRRLRELVERALRDGRLHPAPGGWRWDRAFFSSVETAADERPLLGTLEALPAECLRALSAAALLGQRFSLGALGAVLGQEPEACRALLLPAVDAWLLLPGDADNFRFGRERIRQCFADRLPADECTALHRAVGWALATEGAWFEAVEHLRAALSLLGPDERLRMARLAHDAGEKAWAAAAFQAAADCFDAGTCALGDAGWDTHYALMLALTTGACRAARLSGQAQRRDQHIEALLRRARTTADQAPAWLVRVADAIDAGQPNQAIAISDAFLRLAGRAQITKIRPMALLVSVFQVLIMLRGRAPESLVVMPQASDGLAVAIQRIQVAVAKAQFQTTPAVIPQAIIRDVRDVLRDGVTPWGAHCWTGVAMLLIMGPRWVKLGTRFGQLSLDQVNHLQRPDLWPVVAFVQTFAILPWSVQHRDLVRPMTEVAAGAFASGDLDTAMTARTVRDGLMLLSGTPLADVQAGLEETAALARRHRTVLHASTGAIFQRLVRQLRGEPDDGPPPQDPGVEDELLLKGTGLIAGLVLGTDIDWTFLRSVMMRAPVVAFPHLYLWTYAGVAALHRSRAGSLSVARSSTIYWRACRQVRRWARHRPARRYRLDWLRAERHHQLGRARSALRLYEAALKGARAEGILLDAALIAEHAAELCASLGLERMAQAMSREALGEYRSWGAAARLVPAESARSVSRRSTGTTNVDTLDLLSIIKASQALSEEVGYSRLLERIMGTLLENTGATSGLVVLDAQAGPQVAAMASVTRQAHALPEPLVGSGLGPEALIQFVLRTGEEVVLSNTDEADDWFPDPLAPRPRAVLCSPIGRGGAIRGVVYLENTLVPGCFTRERLEAAHLLMSQVAISLENAGLVEGLEARVAQRTAELEAARQRAESASQAKSTFLANMSHELRTPLNAILGYAQLLKEDASLAPKQKDGLHTIHRSGTHLLGLINDVLDMSRIEAGRLELDEGPTQTEALLAGVVDIFRVSAAEKGIGLSLHLDPSLPPGIVVDARRVRQLLLNLIGNAVKFTDQGEVTVTVTQADGALSVAITDTGPGIRPEKLELIFEAFEQAGGAEQRAKGTGLGLAITRQLATRMGGAIAVASSTTLPTGSTFTLTLPLRPHAVEPVPRAVRPTLPGAVSRAPMTVPGAETLRTLLERVQVGDLRAVTAQAERLSEHPVLQERLLSLARDFDDHGIEALIEELLTS